MYDKRQYFKSLVVISLALMLMAQSWLCLAGPQDLEQLIETYRKTVDFYTVDDQVDWQKVEQFIGQPVGDPRTVLRQDGIKPSKGNRFRIFDLLHISSDEVNQRFPKEYLPAIRQGWQTYLAGNNITADLLIATRDSIAAGIPEYTDSPNEKLLSHFETFWRSSVSGKNEFPLIIMDPHDFTHPDTLGWIKDYHNWADLSELKNLLTYLLISKNPRNHPDFVANFELWMIYIEELERKSTRTGWRFSFSIKENFDLGIHQIAIHAPPDLIASPNYETFLNNYRQLVDELFTIDQNLFDTPEKHMKEFIKRSNIHNYFHILNNGNGRLYQIMLQAESLKHRWPLHFFLQPRVTYTNSLKSIDVIIESNLENLQLFVDLMQCKND